MRAPNDTHQEPDEDCEIGQTTSGKVLLAIVGNGQRAEIKMAPEMARIVAERIQEIVGTKANVEGWRPGNKPPEVNETMAVALLSNGEMQVAWYVPHPVFPQWRHRFGQLENVVAWMPIFPPPNDKVPELLAKIERETRP